MSTRFLMVPPLLIAAFLAPAAAQAAAITGNEAALARGFALPALGELDLPDPGRFAQQLDLDLINEFVLIEAPGEFIELDGETKRLGWRLRYGAGNGWELGLTLPYYFQGGGSLDSGIENWHDFFGLPNGNREQRPRNQNRYRYVRDEQTLLDVNDAGDGFGDLRLQAGHALVEGAVLRAQLKLPTGDAGRLTGNEAVGAALWVDTTLSFATGSRWEGYASAGLSYNADGEVLADLQRNYLPFAGLGLSVMLLPSLSAVAQVAVHGPLYRDSELDALDAVGVPISFGFSYRLTPETELELLVQEDASVYASPDFVLHLGLALR
jgi:hypothetical protein